MSDSAAAAAGATVTASTTAAFKRAALGINAAEQDLFETPDPVPNVEDEDAIPDADELEAAGDSVEINTANLGSAKLAQKRFADAKLDLHGVDRSDTLKGRKNRYRPPTSVFLAGVAKYELGADDSDKPKESMLQRYMRLQAEVAELTEEVAAKAAADSTSKVEQDVTAGALHANLIGLQRSLAELKDSSPAAGAMLDADLGAAALVRAHNQLSERLLAHVRGATAAAPSSATGAAAASAGAGGGAAVTYEVFVRPDAAAAERLAKVGDIERRLAELEQLVGVGAAAAAGLGSHGGGGSGGSTDLQSAVVSLDTRLTLLDEEKLQRLQRRIATVSQALQELIEKKATLPDAAAAAANIDSLLAKVSKWDAITDEIPLLVERLQALSRLHSEAANFSASLERLDLAQNELAASLTVQGSLLSKMEASMAANMAVIATNVEALDKRIAAVKK